MDQRLGPGLTMKNEDLPISNNWDNLLMHLESSLLADRTIAGDRSAFIEDGFW